MIEKFVGKICPYDNQPIKEDEIVICSECQTPHHKECWKKNNKCSTPGCKGKALIPKKVSIPKGNLPNTDKEEGISIGKLIVDQSTLDRIIKTAEAKGKDLTSTQVISAIKDKSIDVLLQDINKLPDVEGSLIVSKDGLIITNTMPPEIDKELIGALCSALFSNTDIQVKRMHGDKLKKMILETESGIATLVEVEIGTLVIFSKITKDFNLNRLLAAVISVTGK